MQRFKADITGVLSASLCIVHCALTPLLLIVFSASEWLHSLSYIFLLLSFYSVFEATKHSKYSAVLQLIWVSFAVLALSVLFEDDFPWLHLLSYPASIGLIVGHLLNIHYCKKCNKHYDEH
jgi:hypothetical protein